MKCGIFAQLLFTLPKMEKDARTFVYNQIRVSVKSIQTKKKNKNKKKTKKNKNKKKRKNQEEKK